MNLTALCLFCRSYRSTHRVCQKCVRFFRRHSRHGVFVCVCIVCCFCCFSIMAIACVYICVVLCTTTDNDDDVSGNITFRQILLSFSQSLLVLSIFKMRHPFFHRFFFPLRSCADFFFFISAEKQNLT